MPELVGSTEDESLGKEPLGRGCYLRGVVPSLRVGCVGGLSALDLILGEVGPDNHGIGNLGCVGDAIWPVEPDQRYRIGRVRVGKDVGTTGESSSREHTQLRSVCEAVASAGGDEPVIAVCHVIGLSSQSFALGLLIAAAFIVFGDLPVEFGTFTIYRDPLVVLRSKLGNAHTRIVLNAEDALSGRLALPLLPRKHSVNP